MCDSICITVRVLCDPDVIYQYGLVLVSTGQLKTVKLSVDCDHVKTQILKLNANNNKLAYAA